MNEKIDRVLDSMNEYKKQFAEGKMNERCLDFLLFSCELEIKQLLEEMQND